MSLTVRSNRARVQEYDGFRLVELAGEPYERGRQHGVALRDGVRLFRDRLYGDIVFKRGRRAGVAFTAVLWGLLSRMHRHIPRELREEIQGVADGAGVSYRDVLLFNCFDDVLHGLTQVGTVLTPVFNHRFVAPILGRVSTAGGRMGCSSFVLDGSRTDTGRPLHGRNLDYMLSDGFMDPDGIVPRVLRDYVVVFVVRPSRGRPFASVAWPGFVGSVTAMNGDGLSLACLTSTVARETPNGIPLPLLYRLLAQYSGTVEEAEWLLRGARRTIGNNLTVADAVDGGDARLFEFTPDRLAALRPRDGLVRATNHFQDPRMAELQVGWVVPSSERRLARLGELLSDGTVGVGAAQAALVDVCPVAGADSEWDCLRNPGTIYSTVTDPVDRVLWLRTDDGADRPFVELDLADRLVVDRIPTAA